MPVIIAIILFSLNNYAGDFQKLETCNMGVLHKAPAGVILNGADRLQVLYEELSYPEGNPMRYRGDHITSDTSNNWSILFDTPWNFKITDAQYLFSTEFFGAQYFTEFCFQNTNAQNGNYFLTLQVSLGVPQGSRDYARQSHLSGHIEVDCQLGSASQPLDDSFTPSFHWSSSIYSYADGLIQLQTPVNQTPNYIPQKCLVRVYYSEDSRSARGNTVTPKQVQTDVSMERL